jgi:hypothetical protein
VKQLKQAFIIPLRSISTALAVSAIALLPVLSWQAIDGRSSLAVASQIDAKPVATKKAVTETVVGKSSPTWGHLKSDRLPVRSFARNAVIEDDGQLANVADALSLEADDTVEPQSEAATITVPAIDFSQFADWLVPVPSGNGTVKIVSFAARKSHDNRKACRANHRAIVDAFGIEDARIMADRPMLFQSRICAANGEIVITCFGTTATVSPRKNRPGGHCSRRS